MATDKPRITITLEPNEYAVLHRLAKLQGGSMSRILREFMGEVTPILSKVADSLEVAQRASEGAKANLRRAAQAAEDELRPLAEFAKDQFDMFAGELQKIVDVDPVEPAPDAATDADAGRAGAVAGEGAGANPRPVITGVTKSQRKATKGKGRADGVAAKASSEGASLRAK
jgi:hypothetical protein